MNTKHLIIATTTLITLAGCGGGGDSTATTTDTGLATGSTFVGEVTITRNTSGAQRTTGAATTTRPTVTASSFSAIKLSFLAGSTTVNETIDAAPPGVSTPIARLNNLRLGGTTFTYSRFGIFIVRSGNPLASLHAAPFFVAENSPRNDPVSGTYTGTATITWVSGGVGFDSLQNCAVSIAYTAAKQTFVTSLSDCKSDLAGALFSGAFTLTSSATGTTVSDNTLQVTSQGRSTMFATTTTGTRNAAIMFAGPNGEEIVGSLTNSATTNGLGGVIVVSFGGQRQ